MSWPTRSWTSAPAVRAPLLQFVSSTTIRRGTHGLVRPPCRPARGLSRRPHHRLRPVPDSHGTGTVADRGDHQRQEDAAGRHQQLFRPDLRSQLHGRRDRGDPRRGYRDHRLAHRQRQLQRTCRAGEGNRRLLRQEALHGVHHRLPGQPRRDLDAGRAGRFPADRCRQPRLDLRRLQDDPGRGRALQAQRSRKPRGPVAPARRQAGQPRGRAGRHLLDAGRQRAAAGVRRRLQEAWCLRAGRRGAFAGRAGRARPRAVRVDRRDRRLPLHRRHLLQDPGRDRRLLRVGRSRLRHPARHRARLHVHRLAAALDRRLGAPGLAGRAGQAGAAHAAVGQRRHPLRRAEGAGLHARPRPTA